MIDDIARQIPCSLVYVITKCEHPLLHLNPCRAIDCNNRFRLGAGR